MIYVHAQKNQTTLYTGKKKKEPISSECTSLIVPVLLSGRGGKPRHFVFAGAGCGRI